MRAIVGTLVSVMVLMLIGLIVVNSLISSVSQAGWSTSANTTWTSLTGNIWVAFSLLVILPIIIGAVALLAYVNFGASKA